MPDSLGHERPSKIAGPRKGIQVVRSCEHLSGCAATALEAPLHGKFRPEALLMPWKQPRRSPTASAMKGLGKESRTHGMGRFGQKEGHGARKSLAERTGRLIRNVRSCEHLGMPPQRPDDSDCNDLSNVQSTCFPQPVKDSNADNMEGLRAAMFAAANIRMPAD